MTLPSTNTADSGSSHAAQLFWSRYFTVYDTLNQARPYQSMIARQIELLDPHPGDTALDAGTGSGNFAAALVRRGATVTGIDFCEPAFVLARAKAPTAVFQFGDLTRPLAFADATFDLVACSAVLHVLNRAEQQTALRELARVLRPDGRLVVTAFAEGFNPITVYADSLRAEKQATGLIPTIGFALRYSWNTARILYYVRRIQRQRQAGAYAYVDENSLRDLLVRAGLAPASFDRTLAGQCVTALARRPAATPRLA